MGVAAILAIAVVAWAILPLWDSWCRMGDELAPKVQALQRARERLERRRTLLARRARLVKQIGWVAPPIEEPEKRSKESGGGDAAPKPRNGPPNAEAKPNAGPPETEAKPNSGPPNAEAKPNAKPPERAGFEAELEKAAAKSKVQMKSLVGEKARPGVRLTCFKPRLFRLEAEAKPEALVALLHALEKGPRLVRVDELVLRQDVEKPGPLKVTLQVAAYERADGAEGSAR